MTYKRQYWYEKENQIAMQPKYSGNVADAPFTRRWPVSVAATQVAGPPEHPQKKKRILSFTSLSTYLPLYLG